MRRGKTSIADFAILFLPWLFAGAICFVMGIVIYGNLIEKGRW